MKYSIGIVTYNKRFDAFFSPLLKGIKESNPEVEVLVAVNGHHKISFNESYRKKMLNFLYEYPRVFATFYPEFRSLAKIWNNLLMNSSNEHMLLLNDDVFITKDFWEPLEESIKKTNGKSFKINSNWGHVFLNREEIDKANWFDERLLGVGGEDGDMEWRYLQKFGGDQFRSESINGILNRGNQTSVPNFAQRKARLINHKFFVINSEILYEIKYEPDSKEKARGIQNLARYGRCVSEKEPCQNQYPYEKFYWENKHKI